MPQLTSAFLVRMIMKVITFSMCCTIIPRTLSQPYTLQSHMAATKLISPPCRCLATNLCHATGTFGKKTDTLYVFKYPSEYDEKSLLKPTIKINSSLIIKEEDKIQHIMASLALKVTSQSVIIGKLIAYARKNRTKKALWELDNIYRSSYLLTYVDSVTLRRNVQRALNRGESYHKLRRAVAYAYSGVAIEFGNYSTLRN